MKSTLGIATAIGLTVCASFASEAAIAQARDQINVVGSS